MVFLDFMGFSGREVARVDFHVLVTGALHHGSGIDLFGVSTKVVPSGRSVELYN